MGTTSATILLYAKASSPFCIRITGKPKMNHSAKATHTKESSSNPQSRLKTRKLLGVGEIPNEGYIYRSKICQLLGCRLPMESRLPKGMQLCCTITFVYLFCFSALQFFLPTEQADRVHASFLHGQSIGTIWNSGTLMTGTTLMVLAFQYRALVTAAEHTAIQKGLFLCCCFMFIQCCVSTYNLKQSVGTSLLAKCGLMFKFACLTINLVYHQLIQPDSLLNEAQRRLTKKYDEDQSNVHDIPPTTSTNKQE
uniref:Tumor protein p53-inducible protein 11 n=1 Tax=Trichuris muris TaxID=70415 RepID=A0A5S6QLL7_TRIMR